MTKKKYTNQEVANLLLELAAVLEAKNENIFKIRAYKNAAEAVEFLDESLVSVWERGELQKVKGIGKAISEKIGDIFEHGKSEEVEEIKSQVPAAMFKLLPVEGLGAKKAYRLTTELNLENPDTVFEDLKKHAQQNKIADLEGFGKKSQAVIIKAIERYDPISEQRMRIDQADAIAEEIVTYLKKSKDILKISALGSLRRRKSTIGDIDIGVATQSPEPVIEYIKKFPGISEILVAGGELVRFIHKSGENVDVKILDPSMWGSLIQHFTGSKQHNVALRERALKNGWSLSEHGIKLTTNPSEQDHYDVTFTEEKDFYEYMKLEWTPPEIRENNGEIEQAEHSKIPNLIKVTDIKGDFHTHTNYDWPSSHDYANYTPEALIKKAIELNYDYIAVGDHNPKTTDVTSDALIKQISQRSEAINKLKSQYKSKIDVYNTLEVDITPTGELAIPKKACELLDFVIVSVHSSLRQDKVKMTNRLLKAMDNPKVKIIAHPTGRLINKREGFELNWKKIFTACQKRNIALEINANPSRLDLNETLVRQAIESNVKLVINTDTHKLEHLDYMRYGVDVARRGGAEKQDILNTCSKTDLKDWLKR